LKEEKISEMKNEISCQLALKRTQDNLIKGIEEMIAAFLINAENLNKTQNSDFSDESMPKVMKIKKLISDANSMLYEKKFCLVSRNAEEEK